MRTTRHTGEEEGADRRLVCFIPPPPRHALCPAANPAKFSRRLVRPRPLPAGSAPAPRPQPYTHRPASPVTSLLGSPAVMLVQTNGFEPAVSTSISPAKPELESGAFFRAHAQLRPFKRNCRLSKILGGGLKKKRPDTFFDILLRLRLS